MPEYPLLGLREASRFPEVRSPKRENYQRLRKKIETALLTKHTEKGIADAKSLPHLLKMLPIVDNLKDDAEKIKYYQHIQSRAKVLRSQIFKEAGITSQQYNESNYFSYPNVADKLGQFDFVISSCQYGIEDITEKRKNLLLVPAETEAANNELSISPEVDNLVCFDGSNFYLNQDQSGPNDQAMLRISRDYQNNLRLVLVPSSYPPGEAKILTHTSGYKKSEPILASNNFFDLGNFLEDGDIIVLNGYRLKVSNQNSQWKLQVFNPQK